MGGRVCAHETDARISTPRLRKRITVAHRIFVIDLPFWCNLHGPGCNFLFLHRQHDAELSVAAHHARKSLARFLQRKCFNHGAHAAEFGEPQSVLGIGWGSRSPALNRSTSTDE